MSEDILKHPLISPIVSPTYGIILYQEQVIQIAKVFAGYTDEEADSLRKCFDGNMYILSDNGPYSFDEITQSDCTNTTYKNRQINDVRRSGTLPVYRVKVAGGIPDLYITIDHKIQTNEGWLSVQDIALRKGNGERIYVVVDTRPILGNLHLDRKQALIDLLVITEGHYPSGKGKSCTIVNKDTDLIQCAEKTLADLAIPYSRYLNPNNVIALRLSRQNFHQKTCICPGLSASKSMPDYWLRSEKEDLEFILSVLMETEGWVETKKNVFGFCSTSEKLHRQTQMLLYLLGIRFSSSVKRSKAKSGFSYNITITESDSGNRLLEILQGKNNPLRTVKFKALQKRPHIPLTFTSSTIPANIWNCMLTSFIDTNKRLASVPHIGISRFSSHLRKRSIATHKIERLIDWAKTQSFNTDSLENTPPYREVKKIDALGEREVYDFSESSSTSSYINGVLCHNSMGKKSSAEMAKNESKFIAGCLNLEHTSEEAKQLFATLSRFAEYSFNLPHSLSYAIIAYQTAWLKHYYPAHFLSASINSKLSGTADKREYTIQRMLRELNRLNIPVTYPDINISDYQCKVKDSKVILGLGCLSGIGESFADRIVRERTNNGKFTSLTDFCTRTWPTKIEKSRAEILAKSGCMDSLGIKRKEIIESLPALEKAFRKLKNKDKTKQISFLDESATAQDKALLVTLKEDYSPDELLFMEKEIFGFFLRGHPLDLIAKPQKFLTQAEHLDYISRLDEDHSCGITLYLTSQKIVTTKKSGKEMSYFQAEDEDTNPVELVCFPKQWAKVKAETASSNLSGKCALVLGEAKQGRKIIVERIILLSKDTDLDELDILTFDTVHK